MENGSPFDHQFQRFLEAMFKEDSFEDKAAHAISMSILGLDRDAISYLESASTEQIEIVQ